MAYHAGVPGISGGFIGVDFFFVLSGFLITGLLLAEQQRTGTVSLRNFWARRARRLLPASSLVLTCIALASSVWLPLLDRKAVAVDIGWAALFSANWRFAQQQTDYLAQDRASSPVLHYWSLGVEEQFYFVWPLLVLIIGLIVAKSPARRTSTYFWVFAIIAVTSFAYCLVETTRSQPVAFFGTFSRVWELALGAMLAVVAPHLRLGLRSRQLLGGIGLAGYAVGLVWLSEGGVGDIKYPSYLALVPTLAAAALIAAGIRHSEASTEITWLDRCLSVRPLQYLGDVSYSWYLWHWPMLVFLPFVVDSDRWYWRGAAVLGSLAFAAASYHFLEQPVRRARRLRNSPALSLGLGAALIAVVFVPAWNLANVHTDGVVLNRAGEQVTLRPNPAEAADDVFSMRSIGCDLDYDDVELDYEQCAFGDLAGDRTAVLLGDSHAVAVFPGLEAAAEPKGWKLYSWTKSGCPTADVTKFDPVLEAPFWACDEFRADVHRQILETKPDLVILAMAYNPDNRLADRDTGDILPKAGTKARMIAGMRQTVSSFTHAGIPVVVIGDLPTTTVPNPPACLVETGYVAECLVTNPRNRRVETAAIDGIAGAELFDLRKGVCGPRYCDPVKGDILVYRDTNHITRTYALTLADRFEQVLARVS